jgi:hypothetical protein
MTSHKRFDLYTGLAQLQPAKLKELLRKKLVENPLTRIILSGIRGARAVQERRRLTRCAIQMANLGGGGHEDRAAFYLAPTG